MVPGDIFWFSGNWREVVRIDRDENLLYYKRLYQMGGPGETIMAKSQMLVALGQKS